MSSTVPVNFRPTTRAKRQAMRTPPASCMEESDIEFERYKPSQFSSTADESDSIIQNSAVDGSDGVGVEVCVTPLSVQTEVHCRESSGGHHAAAFLQAEDRVASEVIIDIDGASEAYRQRGGAGL